MMKLEVFAVAALLSGCSYNMTLMPRDSGKVYSGEMQGSGNGTGTMTLTIEGDKCAGPVARVASNETFGFANTYATNGRRSASAFTTIATSGDVALKGILSCDSGRGLRCDITGQGASAGGICVDDRGKVYDALAVRK